MSRLRSRVEKLEARRSEPRPMLSFLTVVEPDGTEDGPYVDWPRHKRLATPEDLAEARSGRFFVIHTELQVVDADAAGASKRGQVITPLEAFVADAAIRRSKRNEEA